MAVIASAPGKVLMTGGYLILERPNAGIVLSTNARFYAIVKPLYEEIKPESWAWAWTDVKLTSPQMSRETIYKLSLKHLTLQPVSSSSASRNPFVEHAVQYAVAAAHAKLGKDKTDALQKILLQEESSGQKPEVAKTGLGSSAAMTTAVVASLLHYLGVVDLSSGKKVDADLDIVHMIAQTAHCIAQGKVGSGFDVSSAVYGSQRYVRFSPEVLSSAQGAVKGIPLEEVISDVLQAKWDHERKKFSLPPSMTLLLGEPGTGGSSTPSMVGAVKKWQKSDPQNSLETWRKLSEANSALELHLNALSGLAEKHSDAYKNVINRCSVLTSEKWVGGEDESSQAVIEALLGARNSMLGIRNHMRKMGEAAGIPIEPESQSELLDATMNMEGVLLAGVPGAGGFDAVFAVTLGASSDNVIRAWSSRNVLALLVREDPNGVSIENNDPRAKEITTAVSSIRIE
ncbi:phosphomevalonate kinase, peroxisomal-like isoform X3 [Coffea arabica]|uniref:phosphomevalonate kinase n=1 Tax=Coffea arabica TaxID=13443 RepID=A0ABM4VJ52_COFAR